MSSNQFSKDIPGPSPPADQRPNPNTRHGQPYQFTDDELRVLRECNRDSFFQRCIPIGTLMGAAAFFGVKNGYLKPNPSFGPTPKVLVSVIIGYFIGKISYQGKCAEKLMQLPDSQLGNILRQRKQGRGGTIGESLDSLMPFSSTSPADIYSDVGPSDNMDLDTTRPDHGGLDDMHRPTIDTPAFEEDVPLSQAPKKTTSYDELRKQNREQYQQQRTGQFSKDATPPTETPTVRRPPTPPDMSPPRITNKYGDVVE